MRKEHETIETLRCSFCNKSKTDVAKLIAGPAVYICNQCVGICIQIICAEEVNENPENAVTLAKDQRVCCSLCKKDGDLGSFRPLPKLGLLCSTCAEVVRRSIPYPSPGDGFDDTS